MNVKVQQVGNSLMVTMPKSIVKKTGLVKGQQVNVSMSSKDTGKITMEVPKKGDIMDFAGILKTKRKVDPEDIIKYIKEGIYEERFNKSLS